MNLCRLLYEPQSIFLSSKNIRAFVATKKIRGNNTFKKHSCIRGNKKIRGNIPFEKHSCIRGNEKNSWQQNIRGNKTFASIKICIKNIRDNNQFQDLRVNNSYASPIVHFLNVFIFQMF